MKLTHIRTVIFSSALLAACGTGATIGHGQAFNTEQAALKGRTELDLLQRQLPGVFAGNNFGVPRTGELAVREPGIKGPMPEFSLTDDDRIECLNYGGSYAPMTVSAFTAYARNVAIKQAKLQIYDALTKLPQDYPQVFSDTNILGKPAVGTLVVRESGIKGEWPEFSMSADGLSFECVNYPGSYPAMDATEFGEYVRRVAGEPSLFGDWSTTIAPATMAYLVNDFSAHLHLLPGHLASFEQRFQLAANGCVVHAIVDAYFTLQGDVLSLRPFDARREVQGCDDEEQNTAINTPVPLNDSSVIQAKGEWTYAADSLSLQDLVLVR